MLKSHLGIVSTETSFRRHAYADDKPLLLLLSWECAHPDCLFNVDSLGALRTGETPFSVVQPFRTHQHVKATSATNQGIRMGRGREGKSRYVIKEVSVVVVVK